MQRLLSKFIPIYPDFSRCKTCNDRCICVGSGFTCTDACGCNKCDNTYETEESDTEESCYILLLHNN